MRTGYLRNSFLWTERRRKGMILLSVLLVSLFLVSASIGFAVFARRTLRRFDREERSFSARMTTEVVLESAKLLLTLCPDEAHSPGDEFFAPRNFFFPDVNVHVRLSLVPLNDKIPINNLFLPDGKTLRTELAGPWAKLWKEAGAEYLENVVLDFLDKDGDPRLGGNEDPFFLNRSLYSLRELLLVPGMRPEMLSGSIGRPGIEAMASLFSSGKINFNTASPLVLSLLDGLDMQVALDIERTRERKPLSSIGDLSRIPFFPSSSIPRLMNIIAFTSDWFEAVSEVFFPDGDSRVIKVILRKNTSSWETVRWEEL